MAEFPDGIVPWRVFLDEAVERLRRCAVAAPEQEARWLVARAAGADDTELPGVLEQPATQRGVAFFDRMLARREAGEPLQYVLGRWSFRRLELLVDRRVLIPRPETEQVAGVALAELDRWRAAPSGRPDDPPIVVDLGTGSGAIGLSVAFERPGTEVWLTDVSTEALEVAAANLAGIGRAATRVRLVAGSWFEALPEQLRGRIAVVVSNPPYIAADDEVADDVREWEPAGALWPPGPTGYEALEVLVDGAGDWLAPGGALVVELAPQQSATVAARARAVGLVDVVVGRDLAGRDRWVVARQPA